MILYLVYDLKNNSCTSPAIAENFNEAQLALKAINPENLSDLVIHELTTLHSLYDLFLLEINENKSLPDFLTSRSDSVTPESTQQPEGASDSV